MQQSLSPSHAPTQYETRLARKAVRASASANERLEHGTEKLQALRPFGTPIARHRRQASHDHLADHQGQAAA